MVDCDLDCGFDEGGVIYCSSDFWWCFVVFVVVCILGLMLLCVILCGCFLGICYDVFL